MQAGTLRHQVTIQSAGFVQDANGEMVPGWTLFATARAAIEDMSGREYIAAGATQNPVLTKITIRYRAGIVASMRVVHGADVYDVTAVLGTDRRSLLLMCERGASNG
jgi:SPP1 family predicted phage head-tail adaptor